MNTRFKVPDGDDEEIGLRPMGWRMACQWMGRWAQRLRLGCCLGLAWVGLGQLEVRAQLPELRGGWSSALPYQFEEVGRHGELKLTGLDIEIVKAAAREAGFRTVFVEVPWEETLRGIEEGKLDFALGATPLEERTAWGWFSVPYRRERIALFVRRGLDRGVWMDRPLATLERLLETGGRVGTVRGYYLGPEVAEILGRPQHADQVVRVNDDGRLLDALLGGAVDAIVADRLAAASTAWQTDSLGRIEMVPGVLFETPLCLLFSKATTPEATVEAFNAAIERMQSSGKLAAISRHYLVPQLMLITMKTPWFIAFDVAGTIAFALSGVLIARRERYDILGACVLAALPAVGGGIMRDMITTREPMGIVQNPALILLVLATVVAGTLFFFLHDWFFRRNVGRSSTSEAFRWWSSRGALVIFDAIGLATFTIIGVMVALEQKCEPLWLWGPILGALTAAGGGVLRDVLRSQADIPTLKGSIYPEIALVGGLLYSLAILHQGEDLTLETMLWLTVMIMLTILATRVLVVHYGVRSLFLGLPPKAEVIELENRAG